MRGFFNSLNKPKFLKDSEKGYKNLIFVQKFFKGELMNGETYIPKEFNLDFTSFDIDDECIQNLSQLIVKTPQLSQLSLRLSNILKNSSYLDRLLRKISLKQQFILLSFYIKYLNPELLDIFITFLTKINFKTNSLKIQIKYHDKNYEREVIKRILEGLDKNNESQIHEIEFLNCRFDDDESINLLKKYLNNHKNIIEFYLNGRMIKGNKFDIDISHLERLDLAKSNLSILTHIPISILNLESNCISELGIKIISDLISKENCTLKKINLSNNYIGDKLTEILSKGISKNNSIEKLILAGNKICDKGIVSIGKSLFENKSIKKISFKDNYINNKGIIEFCYLLKDTPFDKFTKLDFSLNIISHEGLVEYSNFLNTHYTNEIFAISGKITLEEQKKFFINCETLNNIKTIIFFPFEIYNENYFYLNKILMNNKNIKSIFFTNNNTLSGNGIEEISSGISQNKTITKLSMIQSNLNDEDIEILSKALFNNINIEELNLDQNKIKSKGIKILSEKIFPKASLKKIILSHNYIDPESCIYLGKGLSEAIGLQRLMINSNQILDEGVKYISEGLIKNKSLMELNIENNKISNNGLRSLSYALKENKNFLKLNFSSNLCTDIDDNTFCLFDRCSEVKFYGNKMSKDAIMRMINGGKNNKIMKLIRFSIDNQKVFKFKANNPNIKILNLEYNKINLSLMTCLLSLPNLTHLILTDNQIYDNEAIELFNNLMERNTKIKYIKLPTNKITEKSAKKIGEFLEKNNTLKHLNLASNKIGSEGMNSICNALINHNQTLQYLMVNSCNLTDYCAEKMYEMLKKNKSLLFFSFNGNLLSNEGIDIVISALRVNNTLKHLCCGENKNNEYGFRNLKKYLRFNQSLSILEIKNIGLTDKTTENLSNALKINKSLTNINLVFNIITIDGMRKIVANIDKNNIIKEVKMLLNDINEEERNIIISECPHIIFN